VVSNKISSISGITESLRCLNLADNNQINLKSLEPAKNLNICILKNCQPSNLDSLQSLPNLMYLDLFNTGLSGSDLDFLRPCEILQYLNIGSNLYSSIPTIPSYMLRELDLSGNMLKYVFVALLGDFTQR
jgi:hypothetical protein